RDLCRSVGMMNAWVSPVLPWLATLRRSQCQRATDLVPFRRRDLLRRAGRAARQALAVARTFQTDLPHALREAGLIAAMRGKVRLARRYLEESLDVAERQGAKFEHAQTLLARGRIGSEVGWENARQDVAAASAALRGLGADFALDEAPEREPARAETL